MWYALISGICFFGVSLLTKGIESVAWMFVSMFVLFMGLVVHNLERIVEELEDK